LKGRVEALTTGGGSAGEAPDLRALRRQLGALDEVFRVVRQAPDAQAREDLLALQALRQFAAARSVGGLTAEEFETRRQELDRMLDALEQSSNTAVREQAGALRARLSSLEPGGLTDDLARRRNDRARLLARVRLELELLESSDGATAPPSPLRDSQGIDRELARLLPVLTRLDGAAAAPVSPPAERGVRQETMSALLAPCLKCHLFDGEDESRAYPASVGPDGSVSRTLVDAMTRRGLDLAPVAAAEPVMRRAIFTHAPHLTTADCKVCHGSVVEGQRPAAGGKMFAGSTLATELNSPGVENCQSCHSGSGARNDCAACHVYHPPSAERLLRAVWSPN
jgi:hypothetical protein